MGGDELDMKAYELINHKAHVLQTVLMIDPPLASPQCARDCAGLWIPLTFHSLDLYSISNRLHVLSSSSLPTIQLSSLLRKNRHGVPFPIPIQASFEGLSEQLVKSSTVNCFQAGRTCRLSSSSFACMHIVIVIAYCLQLHTYSLP